MKTVKWDGAVVVVTGASRGLGRAIAEAAARRGARVGLVARSTGDLNAVLHSIGGRGACAPADVTVESELASAVDELASTLGPIDVLVACAGIGAYGPFLTRRTSDDEALLRTNFLGTVNATRSVAPAMIARQRGHIVVVGSIAGHVGVPLEASYSASKFAAAGWAEAIAVELHPHGVDLTVVSPGPIDTAFFTARGEPYRRRFPRPMDADRVAHVIVSAVEQRRAEVVIPRRLRLAIVVRAVAPALYRKGAARAVAKELRALKIMPTSHRQPRAEGTERTKAAEGTEATDGKKGDGHGDIQ